MKSSTVLQIVGQFFNFLDGADLFDHVLVWLGTPSGLKTSLTSVTGRP
jgi:hypothetical protein